MKKRKEYIKETSLNISKSVLLVLTTFSVQSLGDIPCVSAQETRPARPPLVEKQMVQDKVNFESRGSFLQVTVFGQRGRHCAVFQRTSANAEWAVVPGTNAIIGDSGSAIIKLDFKGKAQGKIQIAFGSSSQADFKKNIQMTRSVEIDTAVKGSQIKKWSATGEVVIIVRGSFR